MRIGQLLYTFWHTGDEKYLDASVAPEFVDNTLPAGRPRARPVRGRPRPRSGPPSRIWPASCPNCWWPATAWRCGCASPATSPATFNGVRGEGQEIDFIAFDIQHVGADRIVEDWHLEDNLAFLTQAGLATIRTA